MRKSVLLIMMLVAVSMAANAQKFALIDTESVSYTHLTLPTIA